MLSTRSSSAAYRALGGQRLEAFIVGGIGPTALTEIGRRRLHVYGSQGGRRVADALADLIAGKLPVVREATTGSRALDPHAARG